MSKHLRVLRQTSLAQARDDDRQRLYRLNGPALRPIHDWVRGFELLWPGRLATTDTVLADPRAAEPEG